MCYESILFSHALKYVAIIEKSFQDSSYANIGVPLGLFGNSPGFNPRVL